MVVSRNEGSGEIFLSLYIHDYRSRLGYYSTSPSSFDIFLSQKGDLQLCHIMRLNSCARLLRRSISISHEHDPKMRCTMRFRVRAPIR